MINSKFFLSIIAIFFCFNILNSQEIEVTVDIVTEGLDQEQAMHVEAFKTTLENYINTTTFSDVPWEGPKIPVSLSIQLTPVGTQNYSANMFIISKRTISEADKEEVTTMWFEDRNKWYFEYASGLSLTFDNSRYDNIASLLDFYMLIVIGLDLDTYGELDGDRCFQKARNILEMAITNGASGWSSSGSDYGRGTLIAELASPRFDEFRKHIFEYYIDGLELLKQDRAKALANMANTISKMADFYERYMTPSHLIDSWFYSKCNELCEMFSGYDNAKVFRDLIFLNSSNTAKYEAAKNKG